MSGPKYKPLLYSDDEEVEDSPSSAEDPGKAKAEVGVDLAGYQQQNEQNSAVPDLDQENKEASKQKMSPGVQLLLDASSTDNINELNLKYSSDEEGSDWDEAEEEVEVQPVPNVDIGRQQQLPTSATTDEAPNQNLPGDCGPTTSTNQEQPAAPKNTDTQDDPNTHFNYEFKLSDDEEEPEEETEVPVADSKPNGQTSDAPQKQKFEFYSGHEIAVEPPCTRNRPIRPTDEDRMIGLGSQVCSNVYKAFCRQLPTVTPFDDDEDWEEEERQRKEAVKKTRF